MTSSARSTAWTSSSIPTNKPRARKDLPGQCVYKTDNGKYNAVIEQMAECHAKGQPVLVGTVSVEKIESSRPSC